MLLTFQPQGGPDSNEYTLTHTAHLTPRSSWSGSESGPSRDTLSMESTQKDLPRPPLTRFHSMPTPLPPPPSQWQGIEPMQQWLLAKTEEDRRSQEEEKTRQETLRLEQRKVEQMILMESLRAGVPPPMIPLIFAGMNSSGGGKAQTMLDTVQQWMQQNTRGSTASTVQPQAYQASALPTTLPPLQTPGPPTPGEHRDPRALIQAGGVYVPQHASMGVLTAVQQPSGNGSSVSSAGGTPNPLPAPIPRPTDKQPAPTLPTLGAPTGSIGHVQYIGVPQHLPQSTPMRQDQRASRRSSPGISFHHWVPPGPQTQAPSTKGQTEQSGPADLVPPMSRSESQSQASPNRKRKSQAAHSSIAAPSIRAPEPTQQETRSGRQSPETRIPQQHSAPQSAALTSYEFRHQHEGPENQRRNSAEQVSPRTHYGRPVASYMRHEHHPHSSERGPKLHYQHATTSDGEEPSQDTGGSTRSGSGATGGTADPERP